MNQRFIPEALIYFSLSKLKFNEFQKMVLMYIHIYILVLVSFVCYENIKNCRIKKFPHGNMTL